MRGLVVGVIEDCWQIAGSQMYWGEAGGRESNNAHCISVDPPI